MTVLVVVLSTCTVPVPEQEGTINRSIHSTRVRGSASIWWVSQTGIVDDRVREDPTQMPSYVLAKKFLRVPGPS